jgi:hypothetical protein
MENKEKLIISKFNEFTQLFKEVTKFHSEHIVKLSQQQLLILNFHKYLKSKVPIDLPDIKDREEFFKEAKEFEKQLKAVRILFNNLIDDANKTLGAFSSHWGSYIEQVAVDHFLQKMRKELGVYTWAQKYKRYWHKSRNIELDLLALSEDTAYIVEVKNQLKIENFDQLRNIKSKIIENMPEIGHLKKQYIIMCINCMDESILENIDKDIWVLKYNGFDVDEPIDEWKWLVKN